MTDPTTPRTRMTHGYLRRIGVIGLRRYLSGIGVALLPRPAWSRAPPCTRAVESIISTRPARLLRALLAAHFTVAAMPENNDRIPCLRRREALAGAGALGLGLVWTNGCGWFDSAGAAVDEEAVEAASCTLSRELTEGPYWIENGLTRRDVTEDRRGVPLTLILTVEDSRSCRRLRKRADVEIWHADAEASLLGVDGAGSSSRWLRGHQKTNANGRRALRDHLPGLVHGPHAAHPPEGPRGRRRGAHRPALLQGLGVARGLPHHGTTARAARRTRATPRT